MKGNGTFLTRETCRALCVQAPGGGSSREKNMWDGGGEATGVTPSSPNYGGPSAAAERFAVESTATATALQSDKPPPSLSIDLPENWWHGSADAPPPEHSDMGTASLNSVLTGSVQSLWITELCRTMSLTFAMFWKEKARAPRSRRARPRRSDSGQRSPRGRR